MRLTDVSFDETSTSIVCPLFADTTNLLAELGASDRFAVPQFAPFAKTIRCGPASCTVFALVLTLAVLSADDGDGDAAWTEFVLLTVPTAASDPLLEQETAIAIVNRTIDIFINPPHFCRVQTIKRENRRVGIIG